MSEESERDVVVIAGIEVCIVVLSCIILWLSYLFYKNW